jgi:hypothetical protein
MPTPVRILSNTGQLYSAEALRDALRPHMSETKGERKANGASYDEDAQSHDEAALPNWLFDIIRNGVPEGHRSEQFFRVIRALKDLGWQPQAIEDLLLRYRDGIAQKYSGRLKKEVERAFEKTEDRAKAHEAEHVNGARNAEANKEEIPKTKTEESWPDPIGDAAFYGLAGEVVRAFAPHTEASHVALLLQFLAAFGCAANRESYWQIEGDLHPPQIWTVIVGDTAKARKGTSWGRVRGLVQEAWPSWATSEHIVGGMSSGEGLLMPVRDPIVELVYNKETRTREETETDPGIDDKRLLVVEPEFVSALRQFERTGNNLSSILRCLWDNGCVTTLTKNNKITTTDAMVSVIGHITFDELRRFLTRTEMGNGLANRFLFACVKRSQELPFGGKPVDTRVLSRKMYDLLERRTPGRLDWDNGARDRWQDAYSELSKGRPGPVGSITARGDAHTARLALTYALLDGAKAIALPHLEAALAVWRYCEQSVVCIFGDSTGDPLADDIRGMLKASPEGLTRADISKLLGRNRKADDIGRALGLLLSVKAARFETRGGTGGRPEERWFLL